MLDFFMFLGVVALVAGTLGTRAAHRRIRRARLRWWRYQAIPLILGGVAAILSVTVKYSVSHTMSVVGFPFAALAFEDTGAIFSGAMTLPLLLANVMVFLLLPQFFLALYLVRWVDQADGRSSSEN
jgi:hypothetical protein